MTLAKMVFDIETNVAVANRTNCAASHHVDGAAVMAATITSMLAINSMTGHFCSTAYIIPNPQQ